MEGVGPARGEVAVHPVAARPEPPVGRLEIEQQRDATALAVELAMVVGGNQQEPHDAGVEAQRAVRVVLEHVGDEVGIAGSTTSSVAARIKAAASSTLLRCGAMMANRPTSAMRFCSRNFSMSTR